MNDDVAGAEARFRLRMDTSTFHLLGTGVSTFMKSILGFEKEIMAEAASQLSECEARAWADMKKAQRDGAAGGSWFSRGAASSCASSGNIYPPGTEYALIHAEAQLMNAVVAVMHESLTEGIKGFYKLRKAFLTLDGIMETEARLLRQMHNGKPKMPRLSEDRMPGTFDDAEFEDLEEKESDSDGDFVDAGTGLSGTQTPASTVDAGKGASPPSTPAIEKTLAELNLSSSPGPSTPPQAGTPSHSRTPSLSRVVSQSQAAPQTPPRRVSTFGAEDACLFKTSSDIFVHSGANMCFGILLLILSMVPPVFSRLLYIIGFKGDRERGVRMLWQTTKFANVNGAIAGLILLAYYNGLLGFADILPSDKDIEELARPESEGGEIVGYPKDRCAALLADMRAQYPKSRLWKLEEARVLANTRKLPEAIALLDDNGDSSMRQITALNNFELSINSMFATDWAKMRRGFLRCIELNDWSHTIYYYMAGSAELEMYRDAFHRAAALEKQQGGDDDANRKRLIEEALADAQLHKKNAEEYYRKAPTVAGRKRFLAKQMPFEVFVCRKLQKWDERVAALGGSVDLADVVGPSPALEMVYIWNGAKRMTPDLLKGALDGMRWDRCTCSKETVERIKAENDEIAIMAISRAALLRSLGRLQDAKAELEPILKMDK
jgi:hypothetical protein